MRPICAFRSPSTAAVAALTLALLAAPSAWAQRLPCTPCAGVRVDDPAPTAALLADLDLQPSSAGAEEAESEPAPVFVAWRVELDGSGNAQGAAEVRNAGGTPWLSLVFRTPAPIPQNAVDLEAELAEAARLAAAAGAESWFQIVWEPAAAGAGADASPASAGDYAFLLKRAAVTVSGAATDARVVSRALPADPEQLEALYAEEVSAYLDALAVEPATEEQTAAFADAAARLDPGRPVVVDAAPRSGAPATLLATAARNSVSGASATLFRIAGTPTSEALSPLAVLAREFAGDIAYDPYSSPAGGGGAWSFVRGEDLGLRVIARATPVGETAPEGGPDELTLTFSDPTLKEPQRIDLGTGDVIPLAGARRSRDGLELAVADPGVVAVLRLARPGVAELTGPGGVAGVEETLQVESERQIPVEEILRRLQAFEDAQRRRIDNYTATNTTHLRFGSGADQTFEVSFEGDYFFATGAESDWAWQKLYVGGVRWRSNKIPSIPLVQPEKAAAPPLEITFDKTYRYRLRGSERANGRDCWVVEFAPAAGGESGKLFRGTVWVDRQIFARVRTRAVQTGLEGEVLSNEETQNYRPIDASGAAAEWSSESFILPLEVISNQLWSVINAAVQVESETQLTAVTINDPSFETRYQAVADSEVTMVRDTDRGLRYLEKSDETGERVVQEEFDRSQFFLLGGVFYDDSLDFPLPLAGVNYFSLDFRGSENQLNAFLAGALNTINYADPRFLGSKFDLGGDAFVFVVPTSDTLFRDGDEREDEEVESVRGRVGFSLGRPVGNFLKLGLGYRVAYTQYSDADDTAEDFVLPSDNVTQTVELNSRYVRSGYSLRLAGSWSRRSEWDFWGLPGNQEFDPDHQEFTRWGAGLAKTWHLPRFQRVGAEIEYFDGADLDRFSKYGFGFFADVEVNGYQSDKVRAESGYAAHLSYGFELGELLRLEGVADAAWVTDEISGLEDELLAGVGVEGNFIGPWNTLVNLEVGVPVAGPDDGFVAFIAFLKLFR